MCHPIHSSMFVPTKLTILVVTCHSGFWTFKRNRGLTDQTDDTPHKVLSWVPNTANCQHWVGHKGKNFRLFSTRDSLKRAPNLLTSKLTILLGTSYSIWVLSTPNHQHWIVHNAVDTNSSLRAYSITLYHEAYHGVVFSMRRWKVGW